MNAPVSILIALTISVTVPALKYDAPKEWISRPPASSMRVADFTLPKVAADREDASLTIYFFGAGQGGNVQANINRWVGQMAQPDGTPSAQVAKTTTLTANGLKITLVDVSGTYIAEVTPGSTERFNKPGFRQRAAVIETPEGPYFIKLVGPVATVARWDESFLAFLKTVRMG
jgi:hypothetical protein